MGFQLSGALFEGCSVDDFGGETSGSMDPPCGFKMPSHPVAASMNYLNPDGSYVRGPAANTEITNRAISRQLQHDLSLVNMNLSNSAHLGNKAMHGPLRTVSPHYSIPEDDHSAGRSVSSSKSFPLMITFSKRIIPARVIIASLQCPPIVIFAAGPVCNMAPTKRYYAFIKILFRRLDQDAVPDIRNTAKRIVMECTRKNRMGDPAFIPLMKVVEKRLRPFVGETHWRRSLVLLHRLTTK